MRRWIARALTAGLLAGTPVSAETAAGGPPDDAPMYRFQHELMSVVQK